MALKTSIISVTGTTAIVDNWSVISCLTQICESYLLHIRHSVEMRSMGSDLVRGTSTSMPKPETCLCPDFRGSRNRSGTSERIHDLNKASGVLNQVRCKITSPCDWSSCGWGIVKQPMATAGSPGTRTASSCHWVPAPGLVRSYFLKQPTNSQPVQALPANATQQCSETSLRVLVQAIKLCHRRVLLRFSEIIMGDAVQVAMIKTEISSTLRTA